MENVRVRNFPPLQTGGRPYKIVHFQGSAFMVNVRYEHEAGSDAPVNPEYYITYKGMLSFEQAAELAELLKVALGYVAQLAFAEVNANV